MPTIKVRPDQPLFTAEPLRMPLWLHLPWEFGRGFVRWFFVALARDNPHRNAMHNATLTRPAKAPHRLAYWTGKPVVKGPKWRTMVRRWFIVLTFLALVKYAPGAFWLWVAKTVWGGLTWFFTVAIPSMWANLWVLPFTLGMLCFVAWACMFLGARVRVWLTARAAAQETDAGNGTRWYDVVIRLNDMFWTWVHGRGGRS